MSEIEYKNNIPKEILVLHDSWKRLYHRWWAIHYTIGMIGTISAITVASNPKFLSGYTLSIDILAWVSAVSVSVLTFLEPKKRARAYVAAWRLIHEEMGKYKYGENKNIKLLFSTISKGEEIISRLD